MARKEYRLLARDLQFYLTGKADVGASDWRSDPWLYPPDWSYQFARAEEYFAPKDAEGIPYRDYPGELGRQYLFSRIATYGLANWNAWRTGGDPSNRTSALMISNWLLCHDGRYEHLFSVTGMPAPWITCIAQGEAGSLLARAFVETGEVRYLNGARASMEPLLTPVSAGGLLDQLPDGRPFLEEYPGAKYRHVLNGCLYATVGVHDVRRAVPGGDPALDALFHGLIDAIGANIGSWDIDGWSTYDFPFDGAPRNLNTMTYQVLQGVLLEYLGTVSGDARLTDMGDRWLASARSLPMRASALYRKVKYRIAERY